MTTTSVASAWAVADDIKNSTDQSAFTSRDSQRQPRRSGVYVQNRPILNPSARCGACDPSRVLLALVLALFTVAFPTAAAVPAANWDCGVVALVSRVFDGDTVDVAGLGRVRLLGIDAPEIGGPFERPAPFALEARDELRALLLRRWARFDCDEDFED